MKLVHPDTPGAAKLDLTKTGGAIRVVEGTCQDLVLDGHGAPVKWLYNGHARPSDQRAAFLLGRGWSCTVDDRHAIAAAGFPTMAINDYPANGPDPWYWCTGDPPVYFAERVWNNVNVMKFCAFHNCHNPRPRDGAYAPLHLAKDAPNAFFFHQSTNETDLDNWLFHPYVSWGTTVVCDEVGPKALRGKSGARSSMLIGLRLLWHLGYREVYLCGCDCTPHHHPSPGYWEAIFYTLDLLKPAFDHYGFHVYQTNPYSHLRTFRFVDFKEVLANSQKAERETRYKASGVSRFNGRLQDQSDNQIEEATICL
jgi:hypothetical protein